MQPIQLCILPLQVTPYSHRTDTHSLLVCRCHKKRQRRGEKETEAWRHLQCRPVLQHGGRQPLLSFPPRVALRLQLRLQVQRVLLALEDLPRHRPPVLVRRFRLRGRAFTIILTPLGSNTQEEEPANVKRESGSTQKGMCITS